MVTGLRVIQFCRIPAWSSDVVNHSYDYRPNRTPLGPITIIKTTVNLAKCETTARAYDAFCQSYLCSYGISVKLKKTRDFKKI